jgi:hypothetical protein
MEINNILNLKTYGKIPIYKRAFLEIANRFKTNKYSRTIYKNKGVGSYIPKLNKLRLSIGLFWACVFVAVPFITPLAILPLLWGLK